jgi:hypothetical protein
MWSNSFTVMPGLVPGTHVSSFKPKKDVDGRVKPGHDGSLCEQGLAFASSIR